MTALDVEVVPETGSLDDADHFICCRTVDDLIAGVPTRSLCGVIVTSEYNGSGVECDCTVCNHMAWSGCCPLQPDQRCVEYDPDADDYDDYDDEDSE